MNCLFLVACICISVWLSGFGNEVPEQGWRQAVVKWGTINLKSKKYNQSMHEAQKLKLNFLCLFYYFKNK